MKLRKLILTTLAIPVAFVAWITLVNVYHTYVHPDPQEEVARDIHRMLRDYERTQDPRELRGMFAYPPDAGGGMEAMIIVGKWALTHQKDFAYIIEGLHEEDLTLFAETFTSAIGQAGMDKELVSAFRKYQSPAIDRVKEYL